MELHAQIACNMPRELLKRGVKWQDRAVYAEAVLYCRENLTDGVIHRGELGFWMPDMPMRARIARLNAIAATGALLPHADGWSFPAHVWARWNPSKQEVADKRTAEAQRKANYRAGKKPNKSDEAENVPTGQLVAVTPCPGQPEPEPEPEPITMLRGSRPNVIWDALTEQFGPAGTASERKNRGRQAKELTEAGATPEQITQRVAEHRRRRLNWTLTANALVTHWTDLAPKANHADDRIWDSWTQAFLSPSAAR